MSDQSSPRFRFRASATTRSGAAPRPPLSARTALSPAKTSSPFAASIPGCMVKKITASRNRAVSSGESIVISSMRKGRSSWGQHQQFRASEPSKVTDTKVGRPTNLSATFFQTSANSYFGLKIQRLRSHPSAAAACAKLSAISVATIGRATRSLRSCPKFLDVEASGTCG